MEIELSIVLPVYNVELFLERCLKNIEMQVKNRKNVEVIMVDDGSKDRSIKICEAFCKKNSNFFLVQESNHGTGFARNSGLNNSRGKYIYFVDPDDYMEPHAINVILNCINMYGNTDLFMFSYYDVILKKKILRCFGRDFLLDQNSFREGFTKLFKTNMLYTVWNKVYNKSFLIRNNLAFGFEEMGEDTRFNLKVYKKVNSVYISKSVIYDYVIKRENSSTTSFRESGFNLKCEEVELLNNLLNFFNEKDDSFIFKSYRNAVKYFINHVMASKLSWTNKKKEINLLFKNRAFKWIKSKKFKKNLSEYFIYDFNINLLMILYSIKILLRRN
ncbi:glycosyltransferase family 2 protein [Loigolactobacillus coryniformis subsp. coryniformis]|uniref:glycosyltransferase family 2 protein n=1 Tax=Loigolactobacillus coryniformis TaxID=1610 RepID=UPI0039942FDB